MFVLAIAELTRYLHDHLTVGGFLFLFFATPFFAQLTVLEPRVRASGELQRVE